MKWGAIELFDDALREISGPAFFVRKTELLCKAEGFEIAASIVRSTVIGQAEEEK